MALKLVFPAGDRPHVLLQPGSYLLGSDPASEVVLDGEGVHKVHCELLVGSHGVQLRVPPTRGVWVNDRPVDGLIALRAGDGIRCGSASLRLLDAVSATALGAMGGGQGDGDIGATIVRPVLPKFVLRGLSGVHFGRSHPLQGSLSVGRAEESLLHLPFDGISRQHARLTPAGDDVLLEDLGSANGTWLNGKRITRGKARHGDEIRFDVHRFQLLVPGQALQAGVAQALPRARSWTWWILVLLIAAVAIGFALTR